MSSLRNLLDTASTADVPVSTYYGPQGAHEIYFRGAHCWEYGDTHSYDRQYMNWCVPNSCICKVQFELWGGGGGGGGSCCCMTPWPAHAGQYAKCTVCAADRGISALDNCCYILCVASGTCRYPASGGFDGCKSFIIGPGLDNFCACGGCYGGSCCFGHAGYSGGCQTRMTSTWISGGPSWPNCRWRQDQLLYPCNANFASCYAACKAKGKDFWGNIDGAVQSDCTDCGNWCNMKHYTPYSAHVSARYGTYIIQRQFTMATCGRDPTLWDTGNNNGDSGDCFRNGPPGKGGQSSSTFGGGCCCGSEGAYGLVKVTLFCKA